MNLRQLFFFFSWSWANTTNLFPWITIQPLRLNSVQMCFWPLGFCSPWTFRRQLFIGTENWGKKALTSYSGVFVPTGTYFKKDGIFFKLFIYLFWSVIGSLGAVDQMKRHTSLWWEPCPWRLFEYIRAPCHKPWQHLKMLCPWRHFMNSEHEDDRESEAAGRYNQAICLKPHKERHAKKEGCTETLF